MLSGYRLAVGHCCASLAAPPQHASRPPEHPPTAPPPAACHLPSIGAVGQEFLRVLHERDFPYSDIVMLASERSAGRKYTFEGNEYTVQALTDKRCRGWGRLAVWLRWMDGWWVVGGEQEMAARVICLQ